MIVGKRSRPIHRHLLHDVGRKFIISILLILGRGRIDGSNIFYADAQTPTVAPDITPPETPPPVSPPTPPPTELTTPNPTEFPTPRPTESPTPRPTESPTPNPTTSPTKIPTNTPTASPTKVPTKSPTSSPTKTPTKTPTITPTASPTKPPTETPITAPPTSSPTQKPTFKVTNPPTPNPSNAPSTTPATPPPTISNTPTEAPEPTTPPTKVFTEVGPIKVANLFLIFEPLDPMSPQTVAYWEKGTSEYYMDYFNTHTDNEYQINISEMEVITEITSQDPPYESSPSPGRRRRRRFLQINKQQKVSYTQTLKYKTSQPDYDIDMLIQLPLKVAIDRELYITKLKGTEIDNQTTDAFDSLATASNVRFEKEIPPGQTGLDMRTIIIIAAGGAGGLVFLCLGFVCCRRISQKRKGGKEYEGDVPGSLQMTTYPPYNPDEVSTLAEPTPRLGVMSSNESLAGYEDKSIATIDYDYSKAYGGGETSVSSAGGTIGSKTPYTASGGDTITTSKTGGPEILDGPSLFSDDTSFDAHYRDAPVKEELIDIYAPPGKLGVVIDTPDDFAPVVHAIKDSSVIADKLKVGDKLVAVDDEDVRSMTAIKVSKMISRKSGNPTRKLTVIRTSIQT